MPVLVVRFPKLASLILDPSIALVSKVGKVYLGIFYYCGFQGWKGIP